MPDKICWFALDSFQLVHIFWSAPIQISFGHSTRHISDNDDYWKLSQNISVCALIEGTI